MGALARGHCLPVLDSYLEGVLAPRASHRVEAHLSRCPDCRAVAGQRARVLDAARSVDARPAAGAVMRPRGVSGRAVVCGLLVLVVLAGLVAAVWMLGGPASTAAPADADPVRAVSAPVSASADEDDVATRVDELRGQGWALPSLSASGMRPLSVHADRVGEAAEVSVAWGRTSPVVTVRECRGADADERTRCARQGGVEVSGASEARLPVGMDYRIADHADGGWEAWLSTSDAVYRVDASVPRSQAEALLSQLVVVERSGLAPPRRDEDPRDRLERGLDRLLDGRVGGAAVRNPAAGGR